jgi:hypothetical protein
MTGRLYDVVRVNFTTDERELIESGLPHSQAAAVVGTSLRKKRHWDDWFDVVPRKDQ